MQTTAVHMSKSISGMEIKFSSQPNGEHMTPEDLEKVKGVAMLVDNSNCNLFRNGVCLLLQDLVQSCLRVGGGILEDMCYERRRAEACVD